MPQGAELGATTSVFPFNQRMVSRSSERTPYIIKSLCAAETNVQLFQSLMTLIKVDYLVATEREAIAAEAEKYKASLLSPDPGCQYDQVES